jgi:TP901 family phage tail tape measure protein
MAKKISSKDIFAEEDIFKAVKKSAKETIDMMKALKKEVETTAKQMKSGFGAKPSMDSSKNIEKIVKVTSQANKLKKESIQIDKLHSQAVQQEAKATQELEKIEQQKIRTKQQQMRLSSQERKEKERLQKIEEKRKKTLADESNAYKRLVKETRNAKNESKRLGAELLLLEKAGKRNTKEYRDLSRSYNQMTRSAKEGDKALKKLDKSVGDNFRNVGNYKGAIQGLVSTLGTLGAGIGIGQIFRNVTGIMIDFDQAQADLSAISGKTKGELKGLTQQAKELGATTQFSATQITEMQIELAKLGFTTEQVTQSTEAVSNFASATGSDLASASKVAGNSLRAFGLEASEMERVVSVLGVATTKSALSFGDYETAISQVGPVAKAYGFSIEETTTLLAQLKNAGFDASKGAIATKNILLNLADAGGDLAQAIGRPVKNLDDMAEAFKELKDSGIDLATALELTDKRSVSAFEVFMENAGTMGEFRDSITNVSGELRTMAEKRLDSVQGQITLLSSAWEGWILGMDKSTGASKKLKDSIGFLAKNLGTIMDVVVTFVDLWLKYQFVIKASLLSNKLMASSFVTMGRRIGGLKGLVMGVRGAFQKLGQAIQRNIVGITALVGIQMFMEFKKIRDITGQVGDAMRDVGESSRKLTAEADRQKKEMAILFDILRDGNVTYEDKQKIVDKINRQYGTTLKNLRDEKEMIDQVNEAQKTLVETLNKKLRLDQLKSELSILQERSAQAKAEAEAIDIIVANMSVGDKLMGDFMRFINPSNSSVSLKAQANAYMNVFSQLRRKAREVEKEYNKLFKEVSLTGTPAPTTSTFGAGSGATGGSTEKTFNKTLKNIQKFQSKYFELMEKQNDLEEKARQRTADENIDGAVMNAIKRATEEGEARVEVVEQMMEAEMNSRKEFKRIEQEQSLAKMKQDILDRTTLEYQEMKKDFKTKVKLAKEFDTKKKDANKTEEKKIKKQFADRTNTLKQNRREELSDFKIFAKNKRLELEKEFDGMTENLYDQQNEFNNNINDALTTFADAQATAIQEAIDDETKNTAKAIARRKLIFQQMNDFVQLSTQIFVDASNRRIEQLDKEMEMAEKQYDLFRDLAVQGNIDAEQSLAEQQRIIDEANRKRLEEEKRQQRLRLAESVFNTYNAKIQAGSNPTEAIAQTIADTSVLLQFIQSIPAFFEGTEDTGKHGEGVDGKGGFHAILHPNERVIPKSLNDQIGKLTNEELTRMAVNYKNGVTLEGANQTASALDLALVVNELSDIKETIKNKPETNIQMGEITSSMMEIVHRTKKGNSVTYNRFKVKK